MDAGSHAIDRGKRNGSIFLIKFLLYVIRILTLLREISLFVDADYVFDDLTVTMNFEFAHISCNRKI